jgi:hopene-associated glycosyltransferase HpnB
MCEAARVLVLAVVSALAAVAWLYLLACHGGYWLTGQRLPAVSAAPAVWPPVTAVVPARDEAAMLPVTLPALLDQDYPGHFEVVLVDDGSTDGTAGVAGRLGRGARRPLRVVAGSPPPDGWAGKVWAMAQGAAHAGAGDAGNGGRAGPGSDAGGAGDGGDAGGAGDGGEAGGGAPAGGAGGGADGADYLLFTDADIACAPGALTALVTAAEGDDRDLVSQMALLRAESFWERAIVPAFVYFFAQLYPFRRVNRPGGRTAAAAGGCMLVRRRALDASGGLAGIRGARIDDVALGRQLKRARPAGRCWLGLTTAVRSVRPYPGLAGLWRMITRSAYVQLRHSPVLLAGTVAGLLWLYALPPVAALAGLAGLAAGGGAAAAWCAGTGLAGWALMAVSFAPMLRLYRLSVLRAPALPLIAVLYAAMTLDSARRHHAGRGGEWKGRVSPAAPRPPQLRRSGPPR